MVESAAVLTMLACRHKPNKKGGSAGDTETLSHYLVTSLYLGVSFMGIRAATENELDKILVISLGTKRRELDDL